MKPTDSLDVRLALLTDRGGENYIGAAVPAGAVEPYLQELRLLVGADRMAELQAGKALRDGPDEYHVTVVSPPQMSDEIEAAWRDRIGRTVPLRLSGLGVVRDGPAVSYFVIASSPVVQQQREQSGLPPAHLHVTLGFAPNDIHHLPKDHSTAVGGR